MIVMTTFIINFEDMLLFHVRIKQIISYSNRTADTNKSRHLFKGDQKGYHIIFTSYVAVRAMAVFEYNSNQGC